MFRSLCKTVLSQLSKQQHPPNKINTTFPSPQLYYQIGCIATTKSHDASSQDTSLTISYLQSSCGLSSQSALSASKFIRLKSTENADHVLQLLRDHGLSDTQIAKAISKFPGFLLIMAEKTLKPKLEYLSNVPGVKLADILSANPFLMCVSLDRTLVASVDYLKSIDPSVSVLGNVLKSSRFWNFRYMRQNIGTLRINGATEAIIVKILKNPTHPIFHVPTKFCNAVEMAKGIGLEPKSLQFTRALSMRLAMSESTMDRKMELCRSLGWSEKDILFVMHRQPTVLCISDELLLEKIRFFKEIAGWDMSFLLKYPVILNMSLNKRVAPRFAVLDILMQRGFIKRNRWPITYLYISETQFHDTYVDKYKEEAPEVVKAFRGELEFKGWGWFDKQLKVL